MQQVLEQLFSRRVKINNLHCFGRNELRGPIPQEGY